MSPPNVLFITADQLRGDFLSGAGHPVVRTPHLDALGRRGASLANAYAPVPVCVPSRYAFMTGRSPLSFGMRGNGALPIPRDAVTLPTAFAGAGYRTAAIGKMHFTPWTEPYGFHTLVLSEEGRRWRDTARHAEGGDDYQAYLRQAGWGGYERAHAIGNNAVQSGASPLPLEHYHTTWCARETRRWIRGHVSQEGVDGRPFFVWCSFTKPHSPYDPPEPYDRLYDPRAFPPPIGGPADLAGLSPSYEDERRSRLLDLLGPEQIQRARAMYAGNVTLVDAMVGELLRELSALRLAERTVVCFTADHGDLLGDHGLFFKSCFFRGAWHVPLLLYAPGRVEGRGAVRRFAVSEDVYPTLLSLAGVPVPDGARPHGRALDGDLDGGPDAVCGSVGGAPNQRHAVRTRRWSYVLHPRGAYEELYDLEADPDERHNLAERASAETAGALDGLRSTLEAWLTANGDTSSVEGAGRLRLDPAERGWSPRPPIRTGLGLRPY